MSRYKISKMDQELSGEEVEGFKNFNSLLQAHKKLMIYKRWVLSLIPVGIIIIAVIYYAFNNQLTIVDNDLPQKETSPSVESNVDSVHNNPRVDTEIIKSETIARSPARKAPAKKIVKDQKPSAQIKPQLSFEKAFPDYGLDSLVHYLNIELNKQELPQSHGNLLVAFTIDTSGNPESITIMQGLTEAIDNEIIQLISKMPAWHPAMLNGTPVSSTTTLPIHIDIKPINH